MSDEGVSFSIDFPTTGQAGVDAMASSLVAVEAHGNAASKAVVASSDAIKAGEASYRAAEKSADAAAKALERIGVAAAAQRGKLQFATAEKDDAAAAKAAKSLRYLSQQEADARKKVDEANTALKAQAAALDKLRGSGEKTSKAEGEHEVKLGGLARGLNKIGGPLGETGAKIAELGHAWERITGSLGSTGKIAAAGVAIVALAAVFLELSRRIVESVVEVARWGVELANANRSAGLLAQGIARSVEGGNALEGTVSKLTKLLPLTRDELDAEAKKLADAGLRGNDLTNALERSAIAAAKLKFGPNFSAQMLSLDEQSKVLHENISAIFGGLKIEGLLRALQKLGGLLDEDSSSGKAIKAVFESLFQPLIDGVTASAPKIERFFIQFEIMAIKALIAIKPWGSTILKIGEALVIGAGVIVGVFVVAIGLALGVVGALTAAIGALIFGLYKVTSVIIGAGVDAINFLRSLDFVSVGKAIIDGLVNGITSGAKAVVDAMKNTVQGAIDGAKHLLGIASPSRVFAEIGEQTGAGMEVGVTRSSGGVQDSLESMVSPPAAGTKDGGAAAAAGSSARSGANISGNTFVFNGVPGMEDAEARMSELLTRLLEGDAASLGAQVPNA